MSETSKYMIRCDKDALQYLEDKLQDITGSKPTQSEVKGIGGNITEYIVLGTAVVGSIGAVLNLITAAIKAGQAIKSIQIEDEEIEDPTESKIENLKQKLESSQSND